MNRVHEQCPNSDPKQCTVTKIGLGARLEISVSMDISVLAFYGYIGYIDGYFFYEYQYIEN